MDTEKMGALIAKMRKEKGLTQKELADQLHVTDRAVSKWERGICCPDISLLEDLANILGVSISSLLNGEEEVESAIKTTITYATESRKQKTKQIVNQLLLTSMSFLLLFTLLMFLNVERRFYQKYTTRVSSGGIFIQEASPGKAYEYEDIFDEVESKALKVLHNQGKYTNEEYEEIIEYVRRITKDVQKNKELYYKKSLSFKEIYQLACLEEFVSINSFDYYPMISKTLQKYQPDVQIENLGEASIRRSSNVLNSYIDNIFSPILSNKEIGENAIYLISSKYHYYADVLSLIIEVGGLE